MLTNVSNRSGTAKECCSPSSSLYWAKRANGRMAPSISGVTTLCERNPPDIPIGSFSHSSTRLLTVSGAKRGILRSFRYSTISSPMRPCAILITASGRISRTNSMKRVKEEIGYTLCPAFSSARISPVASAICPVITTLRAPS